MAEKRACIIGAGLAGSEAAWQLAQSGLEVDLYEMRGVRPTTVHHSTDFAELVCSNSLGANGLTAASGLLKAEMRRLDSLIVACADAHAVPAGGALAVDREGFARAVTERLSAHPRVRVHREELTQLPGDRPTIVATGPLTSDAMSAHLQAIAGHEYLFFHDAAAPIVAVDSLDLSIIFRGGREGLARKGQKREVTPEDAGGDYLNCPLDRETYTRFWEALVAGENATLHNPEDHVFFESCLPVEVIARRGLDTLRYGPMKPIGLTDPRTGRWPYAVVQLRQDNAAASLYNMVGFQTQLKWGEQTRIFRMIPGMAQAEFVRLGVMHRNTYLNSPHLLAPTLQWRDRPDLFAAGQMIGVEGYIDSAATGLLAGRNLVRRLQGRVLLEWPRETMLGALSHYISEASPKHFQPMNANWGLLPELATPIRDKKLRRESLAERALARLESFLQDVDEPALPFPSQTTIR
ncbi:MAG: methylenetetrahydrofolate--tRNA-(uracil(54)-C(5))-methyltransferase (FADH(2)-oxidizing) TrmFO [Candidatus Sericytochromatia bacterium]|nr:methylenetetrahydrofolate--tRNA-(uracil(54)-C(5))-methyltransferase (FADH(2)-oxidizing) TrmFO [Candidatus Sericytochromatia bacterium]